MDISEFRERMDLLCKKAKFDGFSDWPFVYDCDQSGSVLIDESGQFILRKRDFQEIPLPYYLDDISATRYDISYYGPGVEQDDVEEIESSHIYIAFSNGDVWLLSDHRNPAHRDYAYVSIDILCHDRDLLDEEMGLFVLVTDLSIGGELEARHFCFVHKGRLLKSKDSSAREREKGFFIQSFKDSFADACN